MKRLLAIVLLLAGCATKQPAPVVKRSLRAAPPPEALVTGGYSLSPTSATSPVSGSSGTVALTVPTWTASSSDPSWLTVSPTSGSGNATLSWSAAPNTGVPRAATLTIADQQFIVSQAGVVPPATNAWVKRFGGTGTDFGAAVATDASGNVYVTGIFMNTVNFGGGDLTSAGSYDTFLLKLSPNGDHVWSKRFGGIAGEVAKSIALDSAGNIFVSGNLQTCSIVKFSSAGDVMWIAGPPGADFTSIAVDSQGNVVATGNFAAPFGAPMNFGNGITLFSQFGATDCFLAKYSAAGTCMFAKDFVNSGDAEYGNGVAVEKSTDNIILAGYGTGRVNLGGVDLTNNVYGNTFGFLGKFTPLGAHLWSRRLGVTLPTDVIGSSYARVRTLATDSTGNLLLGGEFHLHTQLAGEPIDPTSAQIIGTSSYYDMWLAKYSGASGAYQWSAAFKGNQYANFQRVAFDAQDSPLATGQFYGTYIFGPQVLTAAGTSPKYNSDGFVLQLNSAGGFTSVRQFGGVLDADSGRSITDSTVLTGSFQGTASFGSSSLTSAGGQDIVVWKLNPE